MRVALVTAVCCALLTCWSAPHLAQPAIEVPLPPQVGELEGYVLPHDVMFLDVLKTRELRLRNFGNDDLKLLARFRSLEVIDAVNCPGVSNEGLAHLAAHPHLRELSIGEGRGRIDAAGTKLLANLQQLERVMIHCRPHLDDNACIALASCSKLREVDVSNCAMVTNRGVAALARLPLERLALHECVQLAGR